MLGGLYDRVLGRVSSGIGSDVGTGSSFHLSPSEKTHHQRAVQEAEERSSKGMTLIFDFNIFHGHALLVVEGGGGVRGADSLPHPLK